MTKVTTIARFTAAPINKKKKRRTAAYACVSTDSDEQLTSYEAQVDYYTNYIKGREIYFEKENIWTLDSKGELLITIMSSLAQEESRSISENCTWEQRKRFADGIKSPGGKDKWNAGAVRSILTNEKYKGDALLQKSYTVDFLTKKKKVNEGEIPQYYVEGNYEAIVRPEVYDLVQQELEHRRNSQGRYSCVLLFSGKIRCGQCGEWYGSKVWHSNSKYRRVIWQCNHKFDGNEKCTTPNLTEDEIKA